MVSRLKFLRDLVYSIIRKQGVGKGPGITNIGTDTLKLNQEAMDIIAEMQKAGYKIENIDEASIKIFLNNRNQPAPTGKEIIDSMKETDIYSQDNPFIGFKPEIVKDTKKVDPVKATSAKDLMSELAKLTSKNVDDIKLGIASKTKKTKDPVDPVLQELEDKAKPFKEFEARDKTRSGKINYEVMEDFLGTKLRGDEKFDELLEIERKAKAKKPPEDKADGGRIGFKVGGIGKFTKAEVLIEMIKNTLKASKDLYVKKNFPTFLKELQQNPELANDPNVWKQFTTGLPKDQRLVVHSDDSVDFFRQTEFGPDNIETITAFQKKHPFLSREEATRITKMEPEDQILEVTRLERIYDKNLKQKNIDRIQRLRDQGFFDKASGGRIEFAGGGVAHMLGYADGGRIGFGDGSSGSGLPAIQLESQSKMEKYGPGVEIPGSPQVPMGKFGPVNVGIFGGGGYSKNQIVPGVDMAITNQNYGITGQIPIGNTGFTIGGDYMKSRVNERFTGGNNQVFKTVPMDSDRFNVGINFRKSFKDGSKMSRRTFLKLMGGLAALPIVGKYFKGAKTAAKVTEAATSTSGVPAYFPKLVEKIKEFGTDVTQKAATVERQRVIEYKNYELTEDLTTGDMRVVKTDEGMGTFQTADGDFDSFDGISSQEVMEFKKGYQEIDPKTGKIIEVPNEYEEVTVRPDMDGKMKDVEDGLDNLDEILNEVGEVQTKKKKIASGGVAYMLGE